MDEFYIELKDWLEETRNTPLEEMSGFFNQRISDYEEHMEHWGRHYQWMASIFPSQAHKVLDIGCGSGLELDKIFAIYPKIEVVGIDLSKKMLDKLALKHQDKKLKLIQADYFEYDFGLNCYDTIISFQTLHHFTFEMKVKLFKKIYKSLKVGGEYLECDYLATSQAIEDLCFNEIKQRRQEQNIANDLYVHFDTPLTLEHELKALKEAGFTNVECLGFLENDDHTAMIKAIK